jgi:hypothetical protein
MTEGLMPALEAVEREWRLKRETALAKSQEAARDPQAGAGTLVIVGKRGQDKFFSNGTF